MASSSTVEDILLQFLAGQLPLLPVTRAEVVSGTLENLLPLNPITFIFGVEPRLLNCLAQGGAVSKKRGGWSRAILSSYLVEHHPQEEISPDLGQMELLQLFWRLELPSSRRERIAQLALAPEPSELDFEYNFDPRIDRGELYFQDVYGQYRILSPPSPSRNEALTQELGTGWRLIPAILWQDWARPENWVELTVTSSIPPDPRFLQLVEETGLVPSREAVHGKSLGVLSARPPLPLWMAAQPGLHLPDNWLEGRGEGVGVISIYACLFLDSYPTVLEELKGLDHPNLVPIDGAWQDLNFTLHLAYQSWDIPFTALVDKHGGAPASPNQKLEWSLQLAEAVEYLHRRGITHGRLDPSQLGFNLIGKGKKRPVLKLLYTAPDRGICSKADIYTPPLLLPYRLVSLYDAAQEIYAKDVNAAGYLIYYIWKGEPAYHAQGNQGWIRALILNSEWPPFGPEFPDKLEAILLSCWVIANELKMEAGDLVRYLTELREEI